ncbi:zinc-finger homeodomain protein 3-like [Lolium rigidum]|uniref:zinc-finger homeodomain protein 3-like n=1 Tax=Lolium rigidum TaxID=89674 RepID=UPI001F5D4303|nr:zinc-finger homeodomain protein 3-like [Lolium rigidum]
MDLSGAQGELPMPMPMHAAAPPYLGLQHHEHHHHAGSNGRHLSPPASPAMAASGAEEEYTKNRQLVAVVPTGAGGGARYRECLKNHAATIGGSATDGCGEFMPAGEDGSLDALRCSACGCHRNFHRKETDGAGSRHMHHHHHLMGPLSPLAAHRGGLLMAAHAPPTRMVMPLSAMHTSESDEAARPLAPARKRFRTKFTPEQKARMLGFAEEVGWRLQKLEDAVVQRFCQEVGVKRRVLKVWMHNNKHTLARRHHQLQDHHHLPGAGVDHGDPSCGRSTSPSPPQLRLE